MPNQVAKCKKCSNDFMIIEQEQTFYKKKDLPWPDSCPECRQKERLLLRNERKLYRRKCDKCEKDIISTYAPQSDYTVYCQDCFWSYMS
ncbi:MAG: zinc-ribbon domain containing protein [Candidatus Peregrinibacteria bacterium]|nr:zinc-ribbon domain containing protein [Candidatus Peregrinibacteria bacterium]